MIAELTFAILTAPPGNVSPSTVFAHSVGARKHWFADLALPTAGKLLSAGMPFPDAESG